MSRRVAGALLLVGAAEFIVGMIVSEALYSGYSAADNYISDLGVGPSALVFNSSIFLFGVMLVLASYYVWRFSRERLVVVLLFMAGVGVMGVGAFPKSAGVIHTVMSLVAFLFGGLAVISAYRLEKFPMNYITVIMGIIALAALVLFGTQNFFGLGKGGMERMIAYPIALAGIGFGGYLIGSAE